MRCSRAAEFGDAAVLKHWRMPAEQDGDIGRGTRVLERAACGDPRRPASSAAGSARGRPRPRHRGSTTPPRMGHLHTGIRPDRRSSERSLMLTGTAAEVPRNLGHPPRQPQKITLDRDPVERAAPRCWPWALRDRKHGIAGCGPAKRATTHPWSSHSAAARSGTGSTPHPHLLATAATLHDRQMPISDIHLDANLVTDTLGHPVPAPPLRSRNSRLRQTLT